MTGLASYVRLLCRSGRIRLALWPAITAVLTYGISVSIHDFYGDPATRGAYAAALEAASVLTSLGGASGGLDQLGGIIANELAILLLPGLATAGIMLSISSTRAEEDAGRTELLMAHPVARTVPLTAGILTVLCSLLTLGTLATLALVANGVPLVGAEANTAGPSDGGALAFGLQLFAYTACFAGIGFVLAEVTEHARDAKRVGMLMVTAFFFVRIAINAGGEGITRPDDSIGLSWLTPFGWYDAIAPFAQMRWLPMIALAGVGVAGACLAYALRCNRDMYAGVLRAPPGRVSASAWLRSPAALNWKLIRGMTVAWTVGILAFALLMGSQLPAWVGALKESEAILQLLNREADASTITNMSLLCCALLAAAAGITQLQGFLREERQERVDLVLAGPVQRLRYWGAAAGQALTTTVMLVILSGVVYAVSGRVALGDGVDADALSIPDVATTTLVFAVPALLITAVAVAWVGMFAQTPWPAWIAFGVGAVFAFVGSMLNLPDWLLELGLFGAVGNVPMEAPNGWGIGVELILAAALVLMGTLVFHRRDLR